MFLKFFKYSFLVLEDLVDFFFSKLSSGDESILVSVSDPQLVNFLSHQVQTFCKIFNSVFQADNLMLLSHKCPSEFRL